MKIIYHPIFLQHDTGRHPENANRLSALGDLDTTPVTSGEKFLELVHQKEYIEQVKEACKREISLDADTITCRKSYESATQAVGAAIKASESGDFAVVRPPGHHSYPDHASGFCLFNNMAIAVQNLVNQGKKVCIIDFDGHCGDGTEYHFFTTDKVLFLSTHQFPAFPGKGFINDIGFEKGKGFTINIPLPPGSADDLYLDALQRFMPVVHQFAPDVVAVSAGFDAHHSDPLLSLNFSANAFYETGKILSAEFKQIFAVLEGGYNIYYLPKCFYNFLAGINGEPIHFQEANTVSGPDVRSEFDKRMDALYTVLNPFWKL